MKRSHKKAGAGKLGIAVALLGCCGFVAAGSLTGWFGRSAQQVSTELGGALATELDGDPADGAVDMQEGGAGRDLLAEFGSFDRQQPVRLAFAVLAGAQSVAPKPAGETAPQAELWKGAEPPRLRLGVLMVSETARRAVVDGVVVGIGDSVQKAVVFGIAHDSMQLRWSGRLLTYDFDNEYPREFRDELARRKTSSGDSVERAATNQEAGK